MSQVPGKVPVVQVALGTLPEHFVVALCKLFLSEPSVSGTRACFKGEFHGLALTAEGRVMLLHSFAYLRISLLCLLPGLDCRRQCCASITKRFADVALC